MRFLLDTNIISEAGKKRPSGKVLNWLLEHDAACAVPSIALAERFHGAYLSKQKEAQLKKVRDFERDFADRILPFDTTVAEAWGEYVARPALKRQPRSYPDTQIAAIALAYGLTVITRNTEDFPEVQTLDPFED